MIGFYMLVINRGTSRMSILGYDVSRPWIENVKRHGFTDDWFRMEVLEVSRSKAYLLEILDWLTSDKPMTDDKLQEILLRYEFIRGERE